MPPDVTPAYGHARLVAARGRKQKGLMHWLKTAGVVAGALSVTGGVAWKVIAWPFEKKDDAVIAHEALHKENEEIHGELKSVAGKLDLLINLVAHKGRKDDGK